MGDRCHRNTMKEERAVERGLRDTLQEERVVHCTVALVIEIIEKVLLEGPSPVQSLLCGWCVPD